jgi:TonB family protein
MALRCLLISSDEGATASIRGVLTALDVEGEPCADATVAAEKITKDSFRIVIIDWDLQPEAGLLLSAARERKPSERPLTLAIVSDDQAVPKALQAGANSILRKPILISQAKDTLQTARDLLRAREESASIAANAAAQASAAAAPSTLPESLEHGAAAPMRPGSFLQAGGPTTLFDVESEMQKSMEKSAAAEVDPLKDLEPMAAAVQSAEPTPPPAAPASDEPRGLAWYLSRSAGAAPGTEPSAAAPARAPIPQAKPELIGFDQTPSYPPSARAAAPAEEAPLAPAPAPPREEKVEAELFAYISGEKREEKEPRAPFEFPLGKRAIGWALALAALAIVAAPQAPWHGKLRGAWAHGQQTVHGWLNPQLVTPAQAPMPHESFAQAGDEYKLPVAEAIPDATTDPSQIRVTPVIDPTAKKPNDAAANADQNTAPVDATAPSATPNGSAAPGTASSGTPTPADGSQPQAPDKSAAPAVAVPAVATSGGAATQPAPAATSGGGSAGSTPNSSAPVSGGSASSTPAAPASTTPGNPGSGTTASPAPAVTSASSPNASAPSSTAGSAAPVKKTPTIVAANTAIPPSLRTQLAPATPDPTGSKDPDGSLPSIEPVNLPEAAARGLLTGQTAPVYPDSAKGQQGTVVLDLLIGRDGTVQDAKFLQGSLVFARAAIDAVRQWKFKPYLMNGRPVAVETKITIGFRPGA